MRQPKRLYIGQPATGGETLTTVDEGKRIVVTDIWLTPVTGSETDVTLSLVPDGETEGDDNRILHEVTVEPNSTIRISGGGLVLESGDALYAEQSDSGAVTVTVSGWEE